jgi:opacity protein-like surface antigen
MKKWIVCAIAGVLAFSVTAKADDSGWKFEITPYAWLAGLDADVKVRGREFSVDKKFDDIVDQVDLAGSVIAVAENDRWEVYAQADYFSLTSDDTRMGVKGEIDSDSYILTAGAGYQFNGPMEGSSIAVLAGLRHTSLDNSVTLSGIGSASRTTELTDALLVLRPSLPLTEKLRFNPTMNVGAGDSDLTYELQPEFQYNFTDTLAGRLGYRRVYYKEEKDSNNEFKGSFAGLIAGLGFTF